MTICNLHLDDYFVGHPLSVKNVQCENGTHAKIHSHIISQPGMCLIDTNFSIFKQVTDNFHITGDHLRITLFFDGNSRVWEPTRTRFYDLQSGFMRRNFARSTLWDVVMTPHREVSYVAIILSKAYVARLLENEAWAKDDHLLQCFIRNGQANPNDELYYITQPIKKVLQELLYSGMTADYKRHYLELKLKELLLLLQTEPRVPDDAEGVSPDNYAKLVRAKGRLLSLLHEPPTIPQLAREVGLNEQKLKQTFKSTFGTTIYGFVLQTRMEKAQKMLSENYSVNELSAQLGYRSVSHFIGAFKKHFGETPKQAIKRIANFNSVICLLTLMADELLCLVPAINSLTVGEIY